jgi:tetratricopeptide (TPR) repeat protein/transcriptional regulator with XRE-family HTH domain
LQAGLSQEALAERARMSVRGLGALERGDRRTPQRETLVLLADALQLDANARRAFEVAGDPRGSRHVGRGSVTVGPWTAAFPALRSPNTDPLWLVPDAARTPYFVGRDELIARIRRQLLERHRIALCGLGGSGKTQTAIEYAVRHRSDYPGGVFWVNAETAGGLTSGFVAIAKMPHLPFLESAHQEQLVAAALKWMNANAGWLLILDNVENRDVVQPFVPQSSGDVLITSREPVFAELGLPRALQMPDFGADDALRLMLLRTGHEDVSSDERRAACDLATELGNLPLALAQAAAYIAETMTTFSAYLVAFRKRRLAVLEKSGPSPVSHDTVAVTWAANFKAVQTASQASAQVLRLSALLAPDDIPYELFLAGAEEMSGEIASALKEGDDLAMAELLLPLARFSLVRSDPVARVFAVHRLVQEIVWAEVPPKERKPYVDCVVRALDKVFPNVEYATWQKCERLLPHAVSVARWIDAFGALSGSASRVLHSAGWYLLEQGRYEEARDFYERALTIAERVLGPDDAQVPGILHGLAIAYWSQGRYDDARRLTERALAVRERVLGPTHPDVATSLNTLAVQYRQHGRLEEALPLLDRALAIREFALGAGHRLVAHTLSNYANVLSDLGRCAEAQPFYERALEICERALPSDHPDIAAGLTNLAAVHADQGRYVEACRLSERALTIAERTLGKDHPDVALSATYVAEMYVHLGRYAEARPLYERALDFRESTLGRNHVMLMDTLVALGIAYVRAGRLGEAETLLERAHAIQTHSNETKGLSFAKTLAALAALRREQNRVGDALTLLEEARAIEEQTVSSDHPKLAELRTTIDKLRAEQGIDEESQCWK